MTSVAGERATRAATDTRPQQSPFALPSRTDGLWILVAVIAVSVSAPIVAASDEPGLSVAFWRTTLASAILVPLALLRHRTQFFNCFRRENRVILLAGVLLAAHFATWLPSVTLTSVASSTALVALQPAWSALYSRIAGQHVAGGAWAGIGVSILGAAAITGVDVTISDRALEGDLLALVGGALAAAYVQAGSRGRQRISTTPFTAVCYSVAGLTLLPVCLIAGAPLWGYDTRNWLLLLALTAGPPAPGPLCDEPCGRNDQPRHALAVHPLGSARSGVRRVALAGAAHQHLGGPRTGPDPARHGDRRPLLDPCGGPLTPRIPRPVTSTFTPGESAWNSQLGTLRQVVRQELVSRQLAVQLGDPPLSILDIGCGQGTQLLSLAARGHQLTGVDASALLLDELRDHLPQDVRDRVTLLHGDALEITGIFPEASFDVVLCHGVLMYFDDPTELLGKISRVLTPDGILSLLIRNGDALALRPGLKNDWPGTAEAFQGMRYVNRLGVDARADRSAELEGRLAAAGLKTTAWYGVRLFTDGADDDTELPPPGVLEMLLLCEEQAGREDPYRSVAALRHVLATRVGAP